MDYFQEIERLVSQSARFAIKPRHGSRALPLSTFEKRFRQCDLEIHRLVLRKVSAFEERSRFPVIVEEADAHRPGFVLPQKFYPAGLYHFRPIFFDALILRGFSRGGDDRLRPDGVEKFR